MNIGKLAKGLVWLNSFMVNYQIRELSPADTELLETATLGNVNWLGERFKLQDVKDTAELAHYTRLRPQRGDFGILAFEEQKVLGLAWALYLPKENPGWGFVNEETPEISLWVAEDSRRQGLGRSLLLQLMEIAKKKGIAQLSLSVEEGNYAKKLYLSEGFQDVPGGEEDGVMIYHFADR